MPTAASPPRSWSHLPDTYADDLARIAIGGACPVDLERAAAVAGALALLHAPSPDYIAYRASLRALVGGDRGVLGIVDRFPIDLCGVTLARLQRLEDACVHWRWVLRDHEGRAAHVHGDLRASEIVFDDGRVVLPYRVRAEIGDPADDVCAIGVQYLVAALDRPHGWHGGLAPMWHRFWTTYRAARPDPSLTRVVPLFFARRALAAVHPSATPTMSAAARVALLDFAEAALEAGHLEPAWADDLFL